MTEVDRRVARLWRDWQPSLGQCRFNAMRERMQAERREDDRNAKIWAAVVQVFDDRIADAELHLRHPRRPS